MKRNGYPRIQPSIKGAGSVEDGIEFLKSFDIVIHPRCQMTHREFLHYSWKVDKENGPNPPCPGGQGQSCDRRPGMPRGTRRSSYTLQGVG